MAFALLGLSVLEALLLGLAVWSGLQWATGGVGAGGNHLLHGFAGASAVCFVHCLAIFYFVGTGKDLKEGTEEIGPLHEEARKRVRGAAARVHPLATFAILLTLWAAISGAMAYAGSLPPWAHFLSVLVALFLNAVAIPVEFNAMRQNVAFIRRVDELLREIHH
ncbi:MAG: hypothetical protein HY608_11140 [Planctomycetes bacterium]|nr:hypothetical protein [Planctomycetota bacterium]